MQTENLIILGCGAAAHTAAIYASRASLMPLVAGSATGIYIDEGKEVAGFPQGLQEEALLSAMKSQAERFGARYEPGREITVRTNVAPIEVDVDGQLHRAHSVIIAEGAKQLTTGPEVTTRTQQGGPAGVFLCPASADNTQPTHLIMSAAEGCQASMQAERWLQEQNITSPEQRTEQW